MRSKSSVRERLLAIGIALMFLVSPLLALNGFGNVSALDRTSSRDNEPVVFLDNTNSSGLGWGSRNRVAWGDFDNDGYDDLLFRGRTLWRNLQDGTFMEVANARIDIGGSRGGIWGDYDNDGYLDIYQLHGPDGDDRLFHNEGDGTFKDMTYFAGEVSDGGLPTEGAGWGDYDNDGYLDLYVANYEYPANSGNGTYDVLYHNNGDGTFTNVTSEAGMLVPPECGRGVAWADYNDDGYQDIYVANYRLNQNFLWENNGDGTFTNVAPDLGVEGDLVLGYYGHSIGADWGDIDNDGDLDLFVANLAHPRFITFSDISKLYINTGPPNYNFQDVQVQTRGIAYEETHSDPSFADYDNDGDLDLFITSVYEDRPTFLYRNDGDGSFTDVTDAVGTVTDNGWGAAWSDYDNDGFMDLAVGSGNGTKFKLFGNGGNHNNWFMARLQGTTSNSFGIGARVMLESNGTTYIREINAGKGTTSQGLIGAHFGLGNLEDDAVVNVTILWPSGIMQRAEGLDVDQTRTFIEPAAATDFMFSDVTIINETVLEGETVMLEAMVENLGTVAGDVDLELSVTGFGTVANSSDIRGLTPFESVVQVLEWNTSGMGGQRTMVLELVDAQPSESDLDNNEWTSDIYVNGRPVATIKSIDPPVAYQGKDMVTFVGDGEDDGLIVEVRWTSDLDGELSNWVNFTRDASALSTGVHTIGFQVKDDMGIWSEEVQRTLMVEPPVAPKPPKAKILIAEPVTIKEGETVEFEGEGSDPDGKIKGYRWESSLDGQLSTDRKFKTSGLTVGDHVISFFVIDDDGLESEPATVDIMVEVANTPPMAVIELIHPNPANEDDRIRFQGRGIDKEGPVVSFIWRSDLDGVISYEYDFAMTNLSVGKHVISLQVKDEDGEWSPEVFEELEVLNVNEVPTVTVDSKKDNDKDEVRVEGTAKDEDGRIVMVEVRVGSDEWVRAATLEDDWSTWYYDVDTTDLQIGVHRVFVRAFDGEDHSEEEHIDIEVEEAVFSISDLVYDMFTGDNLPCLFVMVITLIALSGLTVISARRGPAEKRPVKVKKGPSKKRRRKRKIR